MTTQTTMTPAAIARRRVGAIRDALAVADDLLAAAYADRDWAALGHASWAAYCAAELPELRHLKLRAEARQARVAALLDAGASRREIAAGTGASLGQVQKDVAALSNLRNRAAAQTEQSAQRTVRTLALLAAAGDAGLTVHQLARKDRCGQAAASACLSRLAAAGKVRRLPAPRGVASPYVITT
jgi:hypothetical protein